MRRRTVTTLQDVAREVGVSVMTVSVVLNGARSATRVSTETRARIVDAAARLRYRPNAAARGLQRRRMETIGLIAVVETGEINLYFVEILNGILKAAATHRQNVTLFSITDWAEDAERIRQFCDGRVDGMILLDPIMSEGFAEELAHDTAFVAIHGNRPMDGGWMVDVDNEGGSYLATRYLIEQGHRDIGHLAGDLSLSGSQERFAGYRRAMDEAGLPCKSAWIVECNFSQYGGRAGAEALLGAAAEHGLPTALVCGNDGIAVGCMERLAEAGLRIPEDISLVGFDDALNARMATPRLTTVRQPFGELGKRTVELLLEQIEMAAQPSEEAGTSAATPDLERKPHIERLAVELVIRDSVAPVRTNL